jgi:fructan beta-fructosidase
MNDPNGLVYLDGRFLLFHQFNPHGNTWGHIGWKQAMSSDLVNWTHLPVALAAEEGIMAFSGSAVVDTANTSGFGTTEHPPVVAIFTEHRVSDRMESISLAYSRDRGQTWHKFAGNPVLPWELDFRDPRVFWHEESGQWIMLVAKAAEKAVRIYRSPDLRSWSFLSRFGPEGAAAETISNWECPDLLRLPIENQIKNQNENQDAEISGQFRWVLHISVGGGHPGGGSGSQYFVGDFTGTRFVNDNPPDTVLWADYGKDNYAAISWSGAGGPNGEAYWIGWMSNWQYAEKVPTPFWRNGLTLPRLLSLRRTDAGLRLVQRPVPQLAALRAGERSYPPIPLPPSEPVVIEKRAGLALEIEAEFEVGTATECGLAVRVGDEERTLIGIDTVKKQIFVDRTHAGKVFSEHFAGRHAAPAANGTERVRLHIFVDVGSVEVFADDGLTVLTELIFPHPESRSLLAYASGGDARLVRLKIWNLNPAVTHYCDREAVHAAQ